MTPPRPRIICAGASLNPQLVGAEQLLQLYARRWEQEIFYKELKLEVN